MKVTQKKWIRFRIYLVAAFFLLGLGGVFARAFQLQVIEAEHLAAMAQAGYRGTVKLLPERGVIYDREGHELALSVEVGSVYAHPGQISDKVKTARLLARTLGGSSRDFLHCLQEERAFVWIQRQVSPEKAEAVSRLNLEGVGVTAETRRYYPGRELAAHLIGFVGRDNQGLEGLEKRYDKLLRGPQYRLVQMRDALGRPFFMSRPDSDGEAKHDLILTIDKDLQYKAQEALKSAVKKAKAKGGHCVIVDPTSGEILAMAVVPSFNPNIFSKYTPDQWRNRAVTDCYEPGSTIKAFLLAAALEENAVSPLTRFYCHEGTYEVSGHVIHDTHEYGSLSVTDILAVSSNIGALKIGEKVGYEAFSRYLHQFGFGRRTEIGLLGERQGYIRPAAEAKPVDEATLFFGQGMTVTSLQLAAAVAAIANGGKLMQPYVVKGVVDGSGRDIHKVHPKMVRRVISSRTAGKVVSILERVVSEKGTGNEASIEGFRVAGKTGTAQKVDPRTMRYSSTKYVAAFVGFVPADHPRLVILVMIDEPSGPIYGGVVAGPVFREVGQWSLNHLRINPEVRFAAYTREAPAESPSGPSPQAERGTGEAASVLLRDVQKGVLPDFRGLTMREVLKRGHAMGLDMALKGTGFAVNQKPGPGYPLKSVATVEVQFTSPAS